MFVCIIDYGAGNVQSVKRGFDRVCDDVKVSNSASDMEKSTHLVLPGVGAFATAMRQMSERIDIAKLKSLIEIGKPFLGICVGMQAMASVGMEFETVMGMDVFENSLVDLIDTDLNLPHVGWNSVKIVRESPLFQDLADESDFYFVHSYGYKKIQADSILGVTEYGTKFPSIVSYKNAYGVQFHPEKSQANGERILRNFLSMEQF